MIRLLLTALAALTIAAPAAAQDPQTFEEQLELFLEWFPGRYDNGLQVEQQLADGLPEDERNYHRHSIFRRVDLPRFGEITFYAEQYRNHDPAEVYRQRIYVITPDFEEQAIRLRVYVPHQPEKLLGAYRDPSLLDGFDPEMTRNWAGCDLLWRWEGDQFRGELKPGACRFQSEAYGQEIVLEEYLILREDEMHFADRGLSVDGEYLFGMRGDEPTVAKRVRPFVCTATLIGPDFEIDVRGWLHDQNGTMQFDLGETSAELRLQRIEGRGIRDTEQRLRERAAAGIDWPDKDVLSLIMTFGASPDYYERILAGGDAEYLNLLRPNGYIECALWPDSLYQDGRGAAASP